MSLKPKQIKCLELMLLGTKTSKQIAEEINITPKTICEWKKSKEFRDEYDARMRASLQFSASKAFNKQMKLLNSGNDMVAHLAAKDLMDRAGFAPKNKVEISGLDEEKSKLDALVNQLNG